MKVRQWTRACVLPAAMAFPWGSSSAAAIERTVAIRYEDVRRNEADGQVLVSVVRQPNGGCEFRLEYHDLERPPNQPIGEIAGDQGPRQRYTRSDCGNIPAFTATDAANRQFFEEQTTYYWTMKARDYAVENLWVTPPQWTGPPIKHSTSGVVPFVLSAGGFNRACFPRPLGGCFRAWPHEGPRIHLKAGSVGAQLVAHEYGHYAAGYVFGHMDTFAYDIGNCAHRSFQETIAEMFLTVFFHAVEYETFAADALGRGVPNSGSFGALNGRQRWNGQCGAGGNDYVMGKPLVQAFHKILWDPVWGNDRRRANAAMVGAFSNALAKNRGLRIDSLARDVLDHLQRTQSGAVEDRVEATFRAHGFRSIGDTCTTNAACTGPRTSRCDPRYRRCIPDDGLGRTGERCTHHNHCVTRNCSGLTQASAGTCRPR